MNLLTSRSSSFCRGRKRSSSFSTSLNMIATQVWTSFVSNFSSLHLALNYQLFFPKNLPKLATIVNFWTCSVRSGNTDHSLHFPFLQSTAKVSKIKVKRKPPLAAFRKNSRFCAESFVAVRKKISWFISKHSTVSTALSLFVVRWRVDSFYSEKLLHLQIQNIYSVQWKTFDIKEVQFLRENNGGRKSSP